MSIVSDEKYYICDNGHSVSPAELEAQLSKIAEIMYDADATIHYDAIKHTRIRVFSFKRRNLFICRCGAGLNSPGRVSHFDSDVLVTPSPIEMIIWDCGTFSKGTDGTFGYMPLSYALSPQFDGNVINLARWDGSMSTLTAPRELKPYKPKQRTFYTVCKFKEIDGVKKVYTKGIFID